MNTEEDDFNGEGARPSSLIPVHKLATRDPMHDLQLLRDVAIINERVRRELGPMAETNSTRSARHSRAKERQDMKVHNLAVTVALATTSTCARDATPLEGMDGRPEIPRVFANYVADDKELLAFKMVPDGERGHIVALIARYPKPPAPNRGTFYEDRTGYSCDLVVLHEANGEVKTAGRSRHVVDCANNRANLVATYLELNEEIQLSSDRLSFNDEYLMGGSYSVSFDRLGDEWHLAQVSSLHKAVESTSGGVAFIERQASYPKDFGYISMDRFDKALVEEALSKNEETYR